jgi:hypothetical protein
MVKFVVQGLELGLKALVETPSEDRWLASSSCFFGDGRYDLRKASVGDRPH